MILLLKFPCFSVDQKQCWCFASHGLNTVSQDEVVFILECAKDEDKVPRDVFHYYKILYQQAAQGTSAKYWSLSGAKCKIPDNVHSYIL